MYNVYSTYIIILYDIYHQNHRKYKKFTLSIHILNTVVLYIFFFFYLTNSELAKCLSQNIENIIAASLFLRTVKGMVASFLASIKNEIKQACGTIMSTYNTQN